LQNKENLSSRPGCRQKYSFSIFIFICWWFNLIKKGILKNNDWTVMKKKKKNLRMEIPKKLSQSSSETAPQNRTRKLSNMFFKKTESTRHQDHVTDSDPKAETHHHARSFTVKADVAVWNTQKGNAMKEWRWTE